jgi:tRNA uridine 5-carboxymethylaminomethyl modification enzyme
LYHHDNLKVPNDYNFRAINGLSNEMVDRLERSRPQTFGQARRILGLTPAALSTLLVQLTIRQKEV